MPDSRNSLIRILIVPGCIDAILGRKPLGHVLPGTARRAAVPRGQDDGSGHEELDPRRTSYDIDIEMLTLIDSASVAAATQSRSTDEGAPDQEAPILLHDVRVSVGLV